jgi:hypothetical protein
MTIRPRLNVVCGRCGKRREGLRHVCRSNSARRATVRLRPVLGGCARCGKQYGGRNGNPLTHVCNPRAGEFRKRERSKAQLERLKARYERRLAAAKAKTKTPVKSPAAPKSTRPRRPPHEYQSCMDQDCQRPVCLAFKEGYRGGDRDGYQRGYDKGFPDGIAACPLTHK